MLQQVSNGDRAASRVRACSFPGDSCFWPDSR